MDSLYKMNQLMLLLLLFVLFVWFGGKYVPKSICKYKEIIFGIFIGLVLSSFMGMRLEGFNNSERLLTSKCVQELSENITNGQWWDNVNNECNPKNPLYGEESDVANDGGPFLSLLAYAQNQQVAQAAVRRDAEQQQQKCYRNRAGTKLCGNYTEEQIETMRLSPIS